MQSAAKRNSLTKALRIYDTMGCDGGKQLLVGQVLVVLKGILEVARTLRC